MPKSYRIRTEVGTNKVLPIKLDQDYDTLDILSMSIFPNDVYTRNCADFGVVCGRVFCNKGLGLVNARVSIFIPIQEEDESNPIISTLYPYKSFADFNEDGYKYNLLPYVQSYSGHVPVGTFPDRIDALTNPSVIEVYDKYYKFTAKTNDSGDFMIFGVPIGQYELFMQVDLSDIGEFSLAPQDLIRMGRAVESQVNGTKFKFSENYSELPQIITLTKTIQVAPFYGQEGVCQHYIVRADFDLTTEAAIELKPTSVFMGSLISATNKKKLKKNCKVPAKQGWLCDMIAGPGQIECIRQTIFTDEEGRPILEEHRLEKDGKLIDENGAWVIEIPMNLEYVYTDEFGNRAISLDGSAGVPTKAKYRFKVKWQQSTSLREENRRAYFLVPNVKEWGWNYDAATVAAGNNPSEDPAKEEVGTTFTYLNPNNPSVTLPSNSDYYLIVTGSENVSSWEVLVNGVVRRDLHDTIPLQSLAGQTVEINYVLVDYELPNGKIFFDAYTREQFQVQGSYAFSLTWADYGTDDMIQEAIDCEDRFYEFQYNKVYTVSQLIDRYSSSFVPQKSIQIKYVNDDKCEGEKNPFPVNDAYYRYDILFILFGFIIGLFKFIFIPLTIILHVLALLWPVLLALIIVFILIVDLVIAICEGINSVANLLGLDFDCPDFIPINLDDLRKNPFKNVPLPLFLYTDDGCVRCRCNIKDIDLDADQNAIAASLNENAQQFNEANVSNLADLTTFSYFNPFTATSYITPTNNGWNYRLDGTCVTMGNESLYGYALATPAVSSNGLLTNSQIGMTIGKIMQTGWNSEENLSWTRLPIFTGNDGTLNVDKFSLSLTIAEKLNLFNTKAKYFDNVTNLWGGNSNSNSAAESISPGNTGWNQIKVTWNPAANDPGTKYHFDNVIVLVYNSGDFNRGDLLTFQDPNESMDLNIDTTIGRYTWHSQQTVYYTNPNIQGEPLSTVTYTMPYSGDPVTGTTCYPMDIEYFQVIDTVSYFEYIAATNLNGVPNGGPVELQYAYQMPFNKTSVAYDCRFSLPYRFLRTNAAQHRYWGACNGCGESQPNGAPTGFPISKLCSSASISNANRVYSRRSFDSNGNDNGFNCEEMCLDLITFTNYYLNDWDSISSEERANIRIMFLQRGVDPNSQTIPIKYDLRRLYGSIDAWSENNIKKLNKSTELFTTQFINDHIVFTAPEMKMNIPIQGGQNPSGWGFNGTTVTNNPKGLRLPYHEFFLTNEPTDVPSGINGSLPLFYPSFNFEYLNLEESPFEPFETKMPTYYSALSKYSKYLFSEWTNNSEFYWDIMNETVNIFEGDNTLYGGIVTVNGNNAFSKNLIREVRYEDCYDCYLNTYAISNIELSKKALKERWPFAIPAGKTIMQIYNDNGGYYQSRFPTDTCDNEVSNDDQSIYQPNCYDGTASLYLGGLNQPSNWSMGGNGYEYGGYGRYCSKYSQYGYGDIWYHTVKDNHETNDTSGYFGREYVEGSSVFLGKLLTEWDYSASVFKGCILGKCQPLGNYGDTNHPYEWMDAFNFYPQDYQDLQNAIGYGYNPDISIYYGEFQSPYRYLRQRSHYIPNRFASYFSPVYAGFPSGVPVNTAQGYQASTWHVDPEHKIQMTNRKYGVFRTDRLPSSTQITNNGFNNTMLLHQNAGFAIFKLSGCSIQQAGGGDVQLNPTTIEVDIDNSVPGGANGEYATVLESLSSCEKAVNINSYYIDNGTPAIHPPNPWSQKPAAGANYLWFERGTGCYNLVSKPFVSLFPVTLPTDYDVNGNPIVKRNSDIRMIVEWAQRLKLTFALCFDIFSQSFSNNWVNGTLYAFPFAAPTFFDDENQPYREYCANTIFYNKQIKNYFYRSSPYNENVGEFTGKLKYDLTDSEVKKYGNLKNLLFPTTIFDMGPKNQFIQELVNSDDYDGYIVNKVPITSSNNNGNILNLFVLSRLVNASFWQILIPAGNTGDNGLDNPNEEGSDDPAISAFFKNSRWQNGEIFADGLLPGLIDADFSQMVSINSEFGIPEYTPENYGNTSIYFGTDTAGIPFFGLFFTANTQDRDYLSPRRTVWNPNAVAFPLDIGAVTNINTFTQTVPFYQWKINSSTATNIAASNTIFGQQSNNFETSGNSSGQFFSFKYQQLDRANLSSQYFTPSSSFNTLQYYNGIILNFDSAGNPAETLVTPVRPRYTFGAPFHFYFGLIQGGSAMDVFITKYVDTTLVNE